MGGQRHQAQLGSQPPLLLQLLEAAPASAPPVPSAPTKVPLPPTLPPLLEHAPPRGPCPQTTLRATHPQGRAPPPPCWQLHAWQPSWPLQQLRSRAARAVHSQVAPCVRSWWRHRPARLRRCQRRQRAERHRRAAGLQCWCWSHSCTSARSAVRCRGGPELRRGAGRRLGDRRRCSRRRRWRRPPGGARLGAPLQVVQCRALCL